MLYEVVGTDLYVNTLATSRKARNIAADPHVAVCIPIRRLPIGPPSSVQFQGLAAILDPDALDITDLLEAGALKSITSHGELDLPDDCFLRIIPPDRLYTYGLGMSLPRLIRHPLDAAGSVPYRQ